ncbi:hypothetical protein TWF191_002563 [Orbilia oligospora]|uniref:Ras-domain-containing protein n=1 Tax=Orbilia oligospora TaxID=2813651 RepID=A0A7C8Q9N5_ORBOL|nr:hypothetical protein TWF191_002563 [Orbilia oligospora]
MFDRRFLANEPFWLFYPIGWELYRSCLLHRFVRGEWKILSSQTIGVEFSSKIIKVGTGSRRKRIKLQLWDTAGQERFRSVTRSYYRGAAGALLIYDITRRHTFTSLPTFLDDARALASENLTVLLVGNKSDLSTPSNSPPAREVTYDEGSRWASTVGIPVAMETSALNGENVDEVFERLARVILTRIELGEVDPDDPNSGVSYGDGGDWSISGPSSSLLGNSMRKKKGGVASGRLGGLRDWEEVFRMDPGRNSKKSCCG